MPVLLACVVNFNSNSNHKSLLGAALGYRNATGSFNAFGKVIGFDRTFTGEACALVETLDGLVHKALLDTTHAIGGWVKITEDKLAELTATLLAHRNH